MGGVIVIPACACQRFPLIMAARRKLARHRPRHAGLQIPQLMTTLPQPANSNVSVFLSLFLSFFLSPTRSPLLRRGSRGGGGGGEMRGGKSTEGMRKDVGREGRMKMRTEETCGERG